MPKRSSQVEVEQATDPKEPLGTQQALGLDPNAPDSKEVSSKSKRKRRSKAEIAADNLATERVVRQERRAKATPLVGSLVGQYENLLSLVARAPVEFEPIEREGIADAALTLCELYLDTDRFERILPWIVITSLSLGAMGRARQQKAAEDQARSEQFQAEMGGADGT